MGRGKLHHSVETNCHFKTNFRLIVYKKDFLIEREFFSWANEIFFVNMNDVCAAGNLKL